MVRWRPPLKDVVPFGGDEAVQREPQAWLIQMRTSWHSVTLPTVWVMKLAYVPDCFPCSLTLSMSLLLPLSTLDSLTSSYVPIGHTRRLTLLVAHGCCAYLWLLLVKNLVKFIARLAISCVQFVKDPKSKRSWGVFLLFFCRWDSEQKRAHSVSRWPDDHRDQM